MCSQLGSRTIGSIILSCYSKGLRGDFVTYMYATIYRDLQNKQIQTFIDCQFCLKCPEAFITFWHVGSIICTQICKTAHLCFSLSSNRNFMGVQNHENQVNTVQKGCYHDKSPWWWNLPSKWHCCNFFSVWPICLRFSAFWVFTTTLNSEKEIRLDKQKKVTEMPLG